MTKEPITQDQYTDLLLMMRLSAHEVSLVEKSENMLSDFEKSIIDSSSKLKAAQSAYRELVATKFGVLIDGSVSHHPV